MTTMVNQFNINNLYEESKDGLLLIVEPLEKIKPGCVNWKIRR
jgi:hypothetical protein